MSGGDGSRIARLLSIEQRANPTYPGSRSATMPQLDLKSTEGLRRACEEAEAQMEEKHRAERLRARVTLLRGVQETPPEERASVEFLERVWFDETLGEMGAPWARTAAAPCGVGRPASTLERSAPS